MDSKGRADAPGTINAVYSFTPYSMPDCHSDVQTSLETEGRISLVVSLNSNVRILCVIIKQLFVAVIHAKKMSVIHFSKKNKVLCCHKDHFNLSALTPAIFLSYLPG